MTRRHADRRYTLIVLVGLGLVLFGLWRNYEQGRTIAGQQTTLKTQQATLARTQGTIASQAKTLKTAVTAIQQQRIAACNDTNQRGQKTLGDLRKKVTQTETGESPAARKVSEAGVAFAAVLIGDLAPHRNCAVINAPVKPKAAVHR